jgi:hypothetical protein
LWRGGHRLQACPDASDRRSADRGADAFLGGRPERTRAQPAAFLSL